MAGLEDKDYLMRQFSQISKMLGNIVGKESAEEILHFEIKQDQKKDSK